MKLKTLILILGGLALGAFILSDFYDRKALRSSFDELEARERLSKASYLSAKKKQADLEASLNLEINNLRGQVDSNASQIAHLESGKEEADKQLATIRKSFKGLDLVCQGKLKELDQAWAKKFSLAYQEITILKEDKRLLEEIIVKKDEIIASLHFTLAAAEDRIASCESISKTLAGKYMRAKTVSNLKTVTLLVLLVLVAVE